MPASPLTIAARAASSRMSSQVFPFVEGNLQMLLKIANEDATLMALLAAELQASGAGAPPGMAAGLLSEAALMRQLPNWSGNIQLWWQAYAASGNIWNACDYLDALPAPPVLLGVMVGINAEADPLCQLRIEDRPLNAAAVDGSTVRIEGSPWLSINDQSFTITVADRPLAQFRLTTADTSAEAPGTGGGGSVFLMP